MDTKPNNIFITKVKNASIFYDPYIEISLINVRFLVFAQQLQDQQYSNILLPSIIQVQAPITIASSGMMWGSLHEQDKAMMTISIVILL